MEKLEITKCLCSLIEVEHFNRCEGCGELCLEVRRTHWNSDVWLCPDCMIEVLEDQRQKYGEE